MRQSSQDGYTLIELLVVIGILALVASVATPIASHVIQAANTRSDAYLLMSGLMHLQNEAVTGGKAITLAPSATIAADLAARGFGLSDSAVVELKQPLSYYADGTSSGGKLAVRHGEQETIIGAAWLTGSLSQETP